MGLFFGERRSNRPVKRWDGSTKATYAPRDERVRRRWTQPYREDNHRWESDTWFDRGERRAPAHDNTFGGIWRERDRESRQQSWLHRWLDRGREPRM